MSLGSRINEIRKQKGLSIDDLCARSGIPKGTLSKITAGITTSPTLDTVRDIAKALECRLDDLDDSSDKKGALSALEQAHIQKYRLLDPYGKEAVDGVLEAEYKRYKDLKEQIARQQTEESGEIGAESVLYVVPRYSVPKYSSPMSAGTGQPADQERPENEHLIKDPPRGTSYIAPVSGDSMEPTYHDGDLLFVHATPEIRPGQIGVFLMDGKQWVKELGKGELISHNPEYGPIPMTESVQCQGLVIGVCDKSYFG